MYNENHAIVAWFKRGLTDEQKENKRDKKYFEKGSFEKGDSPARGNVAKRQKGCRLGERGQLTEGLFVKIQIY